MAKSIISQTGDILNYDNVAAIYTDENCEVKEDGTENLNYLLCADTIHDITYVLGEYETEPEAVNAKIALVKWLDKEMFGVYNVGKNEGEA